MLNTHELMDPDLIAVLVYRVMWPGRSDSQIGTQSSRLPESKAHGLSVTMPVIFLAAQRPNEQLLVGVEHEGFLKRAFETREPPDLSAGQRGLSWNPLRHPCVPLGQDFLPASLLPTVLGLRVFCRAR